MHGVRHMHSRADNGTVLMGGPAHHESEQAATPGEELSCLLFTWRNSTERTPPTFGSSVDQAHGSSSDGDQRPFGGFDKCSIV